MTVTERRSEPLRDSSKQGIALSVIAVGAVLLVALLAVLLPASTPASLSATQDAASITFSSSNVQTAFAWQCVAVEWAVDGVQAVALNGAAVDAQGSGESCGAARPTLTVTFDNGRSRDYLLPRDAVFRLPMVRFSLALILLSALWLSHLTGRLNGLYARVGGSVARRAPRTVAEWRELAPLFRLNLRETSTAHRAAFIAILVVAVGVRLAYITMPMQIDEAMTYVNYVRLPIIEGLSNYSSTNNHLLHTLVAHISVALFGSQEWGVRLPAFIFGLLALPLTYLVGMRLYNRSAGLLGMALVTASVLMIEYSVNARGYSIGTFIFLVQIVLAWHLRKQRNRLGYLIFGALSAVSLGTIPTMLYAVATIEGWLFLSILVENRGRERLLLIREFIFAGIVTVALTALFYLGVMLVWGIRQIVANQFVVPQGFRGVVRALPAHIIEVVWVPWNEDWPMLLAWLLLAAFVVGLVLHRRIGNTAIPLGLVALVVPPTIVVVQRVMPYVRSWQYAIPLYAVIACAALLYLVGRLMQARDAGTGRVVPALAVVAAVGLVALVVADESLPKRVPLPEAAEITRALEPMVYTDDVVVLDPSYRPLRYYFETFGLNREMVRNRNPNHAPGIYVVVQPGQTVDALLETMEIETDAYSTPVLVEQFDEAELYYLTRTTATS